MLRSRLGKLKRRHIHKQFSALAENMGPTGELRVKGRQTATTACIVPQRRDKCLKGEIRKQLLFDLTLVKPPKE